MRRTASTVARPIIEGVCPPVFYRVCSLAMLLALFSQNLWSSRLFFCLYLSVRHISLKSRPCQSDSWFLSPSIGLLQHIIHGITLEDPPVDLILCILLFPLLPIGCNSA